MHDEFQTLRREFPGGARVEVNYPTTKKLVTGRVSSHSYNRKDQPVAWVHFDEGGAGCYTYRELAAMNPATKVIFRFWEGSVIALFPELPSDTASWYNCLSYEHIGQHGGADARAIIANSRPATEAEYWELREELGRRGYRLEVRERETRQMREARERAWREERN